MRASPGLSAILTAIAVSVLWGGNIVSIRVGVDSIPPLWSAFWRMLLGVIFVGVWARHRGVGFWPTPAEWRPLFWLGVLFTVQIGLLNSAAALTSPAYGVVILNAYAVFSNLTGHFFCKHLEEPLTAARVMGLGLALAGVTVLAVGQRASTLAPDPLLGNALMILSSALLGFRLVYTRSLVQTIHPTRAVVWQMAWSVPLFLLVAWLSEPPVLREVTWQAVAAISYQGIVVAGLCFILWAQLLQRYPAGALSMYAFLVPVSGIALSAWIFGEPLRPTLLAGGALVLAGLYVVARTAGRERA
ncbi:MAG: DMT family transporter [Acidobacteria bacterium]|nr:DMT family transporter [Acidobacteriota bacterium]